MGLLWPFDDSFKKFDRKNREKKILRKLKSRKDSWIGNILCRNCLLKQTVEERIERNIEGKRRRQRQLLDDFNPLMPNDSCRGRTAPLTSTLHFIYLFNKYMY